MNQHYQCSKDNYNHGYILIGKDMADFPAFRIEFMYKAHYMMISYRPELCGIWHCYGISRGQ